MPDITMELVPWDVGTTVEVYQRKSELRLDDQPPPLVDNPTSAVVDADRSVTFTDVPEGEWWAVAPINSTLRYVGFVL